MAKVKSMLKKHSVETAARRRTCAHSGSSIERGEQCLIVFDGARDRHCYGREVALKMIEQGRSTLDQVEAALGLH